MAAEARELTVGGRAVRVSHPEKLYYPQRGFTKGDVADYYAAVGEGILRALRDRPTTMERYPEGAAGDSFFQKRAPKNIPAWIPTGRISFPSGRYADEMCPTEPAAVVWAANLGCLTFHPWPVRRGRVDHPDELRVDLDPQPGTDFSDARRVGFQLSELLEEYGLRGWPKTSGGRGLHVYIPLTPRWTFPEVRRATIALARELERRDPDRVTTSWWKEERGRRIFVDYNQMARDRTIAAAYSLRPHPHAPVSAPLRWEELADAEPEDFDLVTMKERFARLGDVHRDMDEHAYRLETLLELAERDEREHGLADLPYPPDHPKAPGEPKRVQPSRARD
ncbi:non-homologous end-joining DNA ligase [Streptomyces sp. NPDC005438]|uniref:non-homologous end-joining DNA ligase n=1 Tax=Streptomyces sp. NPDC005438 TaxID=3156880 RepID=UPI00339ED4D3